MSKKATEFAMWMNCGNPNINLANINSVPWGTGESKPDKPVKRDGDGVRPSCCMKKALSMKQEPPIACDGEDVRKYTNALWDRLWVAINMLIS